MTFDPDLEHNLDGDNILFMSHFKGGTDRQMDRQNDIGCPFNLIVHCVYE